MNTRIVTVSATAPANAALMDTLIGARTQQAATFNDRVRDAIQAQQDAANTAKTGSKAGA